MLALFLLAIPLSCDAYVKLVQAMLKVFVRIILNPTMTTLRSAN